MPRVNKTCGIYVISRVGTNECYVGQTVDADKRWRDHRRLLENGEHSSNWMQHVFNKFGVSVFHFEIVEILIDPTDKVSMIKAEQDWMDGLRPCYNSAPAAGSNFGFRHSEATKALLSAIRTKEAKDHPEVRERLRAMRIGRPSPWKGRSPSAETRAKQSAAKKGKPSSFKGHTHTPEALAKIAAASKGRTSPNKGKPRSAEANAKQSASMKARFARLRELAAKG